MELVITPPDKLQELIDDAVTRAVSGIHTASSGNEKAVFTNKQAMKYLNVSRSTLQRWRNENKLSYRRVSGKILYKKSDIDKLLDRAAHGRKE